jgi:hypothetical protein
MVLFKDVIKLCDNLNNNIDRLNFEFEYRPLYDDISLIVYDYLESFIIENIIIFEKTDLKHLDIDSILKIFFEIAIVLNDSGHENNYEDKSINEAISVINTFIKNIANTFSEEEIDNMLMKIYKDSNYYNILLNKEFKKAYKIYKKGVKDYYDKEIEDKLFKLYISASEHGSFEGSFEDYKKKHKIKNMSYEERERKAKEINKKFPKMNNKIKQVYKVVQ